jgi:hypothetical protein
VAGQADGWCFTGHALPVRKTFLRHAKDGKTWRKAVTRAFEPFFRPGWEGRDNLAAISGLTNLCIVFLMAGILVKRKRRTQRWKESRAQARQGGSIT